MQTQPTQETQVARTNRLKLIWGLVLLVGPTLLLIVTVLGYALINVLSGSGNGSEGELFAEPSLAQRLGNILLFLLGTVVVLTWLPGIIAGIILLATRKK